MKKLLMTRLRREPIDESSESVAAPFERTRLELPSKRIRLSAIEEETLRKALEKSVANHSQAVRYLAVARDTRNHHIRKYNLHQRKSGGLALDSVEEAATSTLVR
jgi:DNA-binding NtrC family response regulator